MERPRTKGARWTNKNIAADEKVGGRGLQLLCCGGQQGLRVSEVDLHRLLAGPADAHATRSPHSLPSWAALAHSKPD